MTDWDLETCICQESKMRGGITKNLAKSMNFCPGCPKWKICHDDKSKPVAHLFWYVAAVRINWKWAYYDILAYTKPQAIKLLRDEVGYHVKLGKDDFCIGIVHELTREQTLQNQKCRIRKREE